MEEEESKLKRSAALLELEREDLEPLSREELAARIRRLEAEIARAKKAIEAKSSLQGAAAALFKG